MCHLLLVSRDLAISDSFLNTHDSQHPERIRSLTSPKTLWDLQELVPRKLFIPGTPLTTLLELLTER